MEQQMKMFQEDRNLPFSVYIAQDEKFRGIAINTWSWIIAARGIARSR